MEKNRTAGQRYHHCQWQIDVIRENQLSTKLILEYMNMTNPDILGARGTLDSMYTSDRLALLQEGGILTSAQIEILTR